MQLQSKLQFTLFSLSTILYLSNLVKSHLLSLIIVGYKEQYTNSLSIPYPKRILLCLRSLLKIQVLSLLYTKIKRKLNILLKKKIIILKKKFGRDSCRRRSLDVGQLVETSRFCQHYTREEGGRMRKNVLLHSILYQWQL